MPKQKTHSGAKKRFKPTASGFKCKNAYKNHILTKKSPKRKRQLSVDYIAKCDTPAVARMLRVRMPNACRLKARGSNGE